MASESEDDERSQASATDEIEYSLTGTSFLDPDAVRAALRREGVDDAAALAALSPEAVQGLNLRHPDRLALSRAVKATRPKAARRRRDAADDDAPAETPSPRLKIWDHRDRLLRKIDENAVSLVFGGTGCGKSTQIPQMLLERYPGRVLCSQPRRLAAVAIAERVAAERGGVVGDEVGYQIGQAKMASSDTRLTFITNGLLVETIKTNGEHAFKGIDALIIDECHERSVESDIVLVALKRLLHKNKLPNLNIILMSATLDFARLTAFLKGPDRHEKVNLVIVDPGNLYAQYGAQDSNFSVEVLYLEDLPRRIGHDYDDLIDEVSAAAWRAVDTEQQSMTTYSQNLDVHEITRAVIAATIRHDSPATTLVFLPTYKTLEIQYGFLETAPFAADVDVQVLHSSVEIETLLETIADRSDKASRPCVILATNIAESSLTISGVVDVVDLCLTNQVRWDHKHRRTCARVVPASRAQCDQRKGRAGRVREGRCWRLLPRAAFDELADYEKPAIQLQALDNPCLLLMSSASKLLREPRAVLKSCLDPPDEEDVERALATLVESGAAVQLKKGYEATNYGRMLVDMPISFDAARLAVAVAGRGLPYVGAVLAAIESTSPRPVARPFGQAENVTQMFLELFGPANTADDKPGDRCEYLPHHLAAVEFWQAAFLDPQRRLATVEVPFFERRNAADFRAAEAEFCATWHLGPSALREVSATAAVILDVFHRYRPYFFTGHAPLWPLVRSAPESWSDGLWPSATRTMLSDDELRLVRGAIKHVFQETLTGGAPVAPPRRRLAQPGEKPICSFFATGFCQRGATCSYSHANEELICPAYAVEGYCRFGRKCAFSHASLYEMPPPKTTTSNDRRLIIDRINARVLPLTYEDSGSWRHRYEDRGATIYLFGEGDFSFAEKLLAHGAPSIVATSPLPLLDYVQGRALEINRLQLLMKSSKCHVKLEIDATDPRAWDGLPRPGGDDAAEVAVFNFPHNGISHDADGNASLLDAFFRAARASLDARPRDLEIHLALARLQFTRWNANEAANDSYFYLEDSFSFDFRHYDYEPIQTGAETRAGGVRKYDAPRDESVVYVFRS